MKDDRLGSAIMRTCYARLEEGKMIYMYEVKSKRRFHWLCMRMMYIA